jgi:exopolysaccharide biosynthesis polyprenyl glycosylphosphotransferase
MFFVSSHAQRPLLAPIADILPLALAAPAMMLGGRWALAQKRLQVSAGVLSVSVLGVGGLLAAVIAVVPISPTGTRATLFWLSGCVGVLMLIQAFWRIRLAQWRRAGKLTPNIVIVGATQNAGRLIAQAAETGAVAVLGVFDDRVGRGPAHIEGVPVLGATQALLTHRIIPYVDRIVITVPSAAQERVRQLLRQLQYLPNEIALLLDFEGALEISTVLSGLPTATARLSGARLNEGQLFAKRLQDLILGTVALVLASPLMVAIAVAIKLDGAGPVFFHQLRSGFNGEVFRVWKFRSMRLHPAVNAGQQVTVGDARVTRVGRLIRRTGLDELPQLFNVLSGEMSLVGPRPHAVGMQTAGADSARLVADYAHRYRMKPGITSWAAIHGSRGPVHTVADIARRVALDVAYIERQSFWLDAYILLKTAPLLLGDRQAIR